MKCALHSINEALASAESKFIRRTAEVHEMVRLWEPGRSCFIHQLDGIMKEALEDFIFRTTWSRRDVGEDLDPAPLADRQADRRIYESHYNIIIAGDRARVR